MSRFKQTDMTNKTEHLQIFADGKDELNWFKNLDNRLDRASQRLIKDSDNRIINEMVRYDKPDIIVNSQNTPLLVLEKTKEVPTGHNISQRFGRIARACELNIHSILMFPFKKRKHGEHDNVCWASPRYFECFERMNSIHRCNVLPVTQPTYDDGELVPSVSGGDEYISKVVSQLIDNDWELDDVDHSNMDNLTDEYKSIGIENSNTWPEYPRSVEVSSTNDIVKNEGNVPEYVISRDESVVLSAELTKVRENSDPYVGKCFMYDYIASRDGPTPEFRDKNFFFCLPNIQSKNWTSEIPLDTDSKWSTLYGMVDGVIFEDKIEFRKDYC